MSSFSIICFLRLDADLVCIMGEIEVKVVGKVRTGELIYTCPSAKFPGTATAKRDQGKFLLTISEYCFNLFFKTRLNAHFLT